MRHLRRRVSTGKEVFVSESLCSCRRKRGFLTKYAKHITVLVREGIYLRPCRPRLLAQIQIHALYNTVESVAGDSALRVYMYKNLMTARRPRLLREDGDDSIGVFFVFAGYAPETNLVRAGTD